MQERDELLEQEPLPRQEEDIQDFDLDDILKEFGDETEEVPEKSADEILAEALGLEQLEEQPEEVVVQKVEEPTVRLDNLAKAIKDLPPQKVTVNAQQIGEEEPEPEEEKVEPFSEQWEPEYDAPVGEYVPPEPIVFHPRSRLRELKRKLVAGPEKRYYELSEQGVGKLQLAMIVNVLVVLLSAGVTVLYGLDMVDESRMKLLIFSQVLAMLLAGLLGCYRMLDGGADLIHGRFTLNAMVLITFLACCADGVFCLLHQKVPCCAAFSLEMLMCQWAEYHKRTTQMGQMDTLRKATVLDGVVKISDYHEGRPGFARVEAQPEDFMDHYDKTTGPEKFLRGYCLAALAVSVGIGVTAGVLHDPVLGVRSFAAALLAALPVSIFITLSRPMALLEHRLHKLGTVICGWRGVKGMCGQAVYPLEDQDLFPAGSLKMNGVKFYGSRDPDEVVAYAAALIDANGGGLVPIFDHLRESRNGYRYEVENLRRYGNGGIGGEVCGEPVLVGVLPFMQDMGVDMPEGTRVSQAIYVAVDGSLCGVFAITYNKVKSSAAGFATLCSYRGLSPVLISGDFILTENFLRSKFGVNTRRVTFPDWDDRAKLSQRKPEEDQLALALMTKEGLAPMAYAVTGARALKTASVLGLAVHLIGGVLGLIMMLILAILGAEELLTPVNLLLYELVWMIPGLLITEWTRSI